MQAFGMYNNQPHPPDSLFFRRPDGWGMDAEAPIKKLPVSYIIKLSFLYDLIELIGNSLTKKIILAGFMLIAPLKLAQGK